MFRTPLQVKRNALNNEVGLPNGPAGEDAEATKYLLRKIPMFGRGPAAKIGRVKQSWDQNPWVCEHLLTRLRGEWYRGVKATTDAF